MFAAGKTASVSGSAPDAQFNYVTMLLHGDGTNGAQNNTFLDSGPNTFTITRNGNTTQGSFSPYGSNWSNYFGGDPTRLSLATATALGTGNVTVEFWFYPDDTSVAYRALYDGRSAANTNTGLGIFQYGQTIEIYGNGLKVSTAASAFTANTWTHFAVVRTSGTCQIYINGVASGSSASYSDNFTSTIRSIGRNVTAANFYAGYISNLREVTSALYSGTFTPSTTPLTAISGTTLLTCQSNRYIDNSTNTYAITVDGTPSVQRFNPFGTSTAYSTSVIGGSGYFDGSGDYLGVPFSSNLTMTGDFTAECWVYVTSAPNAYGGILAFSNDSENVGWNILIGGTTTKFHFNVAMTYTDTATSMTLNAWTHLALVRSGSTGKLYINGVADANTVTTSATATCPTNPQIGRYPLESGRNFFGYISNVRVVKGTAVYTSNFTPPTAPVTAITNTSLLLNYTNGAIFDNAMMNDLETVGNAQISTSVVKYGTGSLKFDGSGDRLFEPSNQNFNFGTGDFTIELWVNPINQGGHGSANNDCLIDFRPAANGIYGTLFLGNSGAGLYWEVNGTVRISGGAISNSVWTHIAICRASGSTKLFINGTQSGSTYTDSNNYLVAPITIGEMNDGFGDGNFNGYIDDLRITKGFARYTANFTPPTSAFSNTGPI